EPRELLELRPLVVGGADGHRYIDGLGDLCHSHFLLLHRVGTNFLAPSRNGRTTWDQAAMPGSLHRSKDPTRRTGWGGSERETEPAPVKRLSPEAPQTTPDICRSRPPTSANDRAPTYTPEMPTTHKSTGGNAFVSPKSRPARAATRSNSARATRPQLTAPTTTRSSATAS